MNRGLYELYNWKIVSYYLCIFKTYYKYFCFVYLHVINSIIENKAQKHMYKKCTYYNSFNIICVWAICINTWSEIESLHHKQNSIIWHTCHIFPIAVLKSIKLNIDSFIHNTIEYFLLSFVQFFWTVFKQLIQIIKMT